MSALYPASFLDALGGLLIGIALISGCLSLIPSIRRHSIKLLALLIITSISLFANHWSTYFAGLFIIATAVTDLDFLQNLAAIIRGNKEYFDYKKEALSEEQRSQKIVKEQMGTDLTSESTEGEVETSSAGHSKSGQSDISLYLKIEEKALDHIEHLYGAKVERGVRFSAKGVRIELDGFITGGGDSQAVDQLFEVRYIRSPDNVREISHLSNQSEYIANNYASITNRNAKTLLILVFDKDKKLSRKQESFLTRKLAKSKYAIGYSVLTTDELKLK